MMAIAPTREQFSEFAHGTRDGEVVMINLLHCAPGDTDEDSTAGVGGPHRHKPTATPGPARTARTATRW